MVKDSNEKQLNKNGDHRGMSPKSRANLKPNLNGRPPEDTITSHVKGELTRIPTMEEDGFDGKGKTNAWWIARNAVRDARNSDRSARQEVWERVEGKVTQPIGGEGGGDIKIVVEFENLGQESPKS